MIPKADAFIMDETFKKESKSFGQTLLASELTDENEIAAAEQAKDAMVSNKSSIFNKTITSFEIAGQVDSCQDPKGQTPFAIACATRHCNTLTHLRTEDAKLDPL